MVSVQTESRSEAAWSRAWSGACRVRCPNRANRVASRPQPRVPRSVVSAFSAVSVTGAVSRGEWVTLTGSVNPVVLVEHRVGVGFSEGSNFYKIRPIFKASNFYKIRA